MHPSADPRAVFYGRAPDDLLEEPREVLRILEAEFICDLSDCLLRVENAVLRNGDEFELYVFLGGLPGLLLDQIPEIVGRQAQLPGTILHRRNPVALGLPVVEVVVQQSFKTGQHVVVHIRPRDELPLVEAQAVVEQCLDLDGDEPFAVAVDRMFQLVADLLQAVDNQLPLTHR